MNYGVLISVIIIVILGFFFNKTAGWIALHSVPGEIDMS